MSQNATNDKRETKNPCLIFEPNKWSMCLAIDYSFSDKLACVYYPLGFAIGIDQKNYSHLVFR